MRRRNALLRYRSKAIFGPAFDQSLDLLLSAPFTISAYVVGMIERQRRNLGVAPLLLGVSFFLTASCTVLLTRFDGGVAFIWVSTALLLAWMMHAPEHQRGPGIAACGIASIFVTGFVGYGWRAAPFFVPANVGEALLAAWLLGRLVRHKNYFGSLDGVAAFIMAACLSPVATGLLASGIIYVANGHDVVSSYLYWISGHAIGTVSLTPIFSLMIGNDAQPWNVDHRRAGLETVAHLTLVATSVTIVFWQTALPLLFFPILPMIIATIRLGRFGAAAATAILTIVGGALTLRGQGPIHLLDGAMGGKVQFFQFYVGTAVLIVLPVAALLKHHQSLLVRLSESEARHDLISRHVSDAILNLSIDGTILYASPAFRLMGDFEPDLLVGHNATEMVFPEDRERTVEAHRAALAAADRTISVEYRAPVANGDIRWFENRNRAVIGDGGVPVGVVCAIRDVTDRKVAENQLLKAATTDALTGLHNRRAFMDMLELRWKRVREDQGRCALVIFDIDHFKRINDLHGHAAGDLVLQNFAKTVRGTLRDADMLARIGGEEFALLLWGDDADAASQIAERIRIAVSRLVVGPDALAVTVSAGIAELRADIDAQAALKAADDALYRAKAAGRNCLRLVA